MEIDRPTAADYARADIEAANREVESVGTRLRETLAKLALAELKLTALGFVAEILEQEVYDDAWETCVTTHRTMRQIIGAESVADIMAMKGK